MDRLKNILTYKRNGSIRAIVAAALLVLVTSPCFSQKKQIHTQDFGELSLAGGSYRGSLSAGYFHNWQFGKQKKAGVGLGIRFTGFSGANLYFITAPARLTSGSTGPLVLFKENIAENIDSLLIASPQVNSFNLAINLSYQISKKIALGFNIDAFGFSFGRSVKGNYINGIEGSVTRAKPTSLNVLLISDNDKGSLNSELYGRYSLNEKWSVKLAAQFLFTEYTTDLKVQQSPEENDRFRNKSLLASAGVCYKF